MPNCLSVFIFFLLTHRLDDKGSGKIVKCMQIPFMFVVVLIRMTVFPSQGVAFDGISEIREVYKEF